MTRIRIGTAGWTVPRRHLLYASIEGSHLERYSSAMNCVEVNSSFYKSHKLKTWKRWANATPAGIKFAVKAPKAITHTAKLIACGAALSEFFEDITGLGEKLGPVLFQLPPKHSFDQYVAQDFFGTVRELHKGLVALEPRHASWFTPEADRQLRQFGVARVAADPPAGSPMAAKPGGYAGFRYYRWHGSPRIYWSFYEPEVISQLAAEVQTSSCECWVIFDNTAAGAAFGNALELDRIISSHSE